MAAKLKAAARQRGISFKKVLGLTGQRASGRRFTQYTQPMGFRPGFDLDKAMKLAAALDEEIVRKLGVRK